MSDHRSFHVRNIFRPVVRRSRSMNFFKSTKQHNRKSLSDYDFDKVTLLENPKFRKNDISNLYWNSPFGRCDLNPIHENGQGDATVNF